MKRFIKKLVQKSIILAFVLVVGYLLIMQDVLTMEEYVGICFLVLVIRVALGFSRKRRILKSSIEKIDRMSGVEFEEYLMYQFRKRGYRVKLTPLSGDFGADLILKRFSQEYIVQAKRYSGSVGIKAVQEVLGAKEYYGIEQGMVVTNSYFTSAAKELANVSGVELWGRSEIIKEFGIRV